MKIRILAKAAVFLILFTSSPVSFAQPQVIWGKQYGTTKEEYVMNHVMDTKGNIIISGRTADDMDGQSKGESDAFITMIDSTGKTIWVSQFGSPGKEDVRWSAADSNGDVYLTGYTTGDLIGVNAGREDIFIARFSNKGKMLWLKQFGTDSTDIGQGIFVDSRGYIYISGETKGMIGENHFGKTDGFVMKFDRNGNKVFTFQFGTEADDFCSSVTGDDSYVYAGGHTWGDIGSKSSGMLDCYVTKISSGGEPAGCYQFGSPGFDITMVIKSDDRKNIYVAGSTSGDMEGVQAGEGDCFLVKLNGKGEMLWKRQFGTAKHDGARSIDITGHGGREILITGVMNLPPAQAFIRMYSADGEFQWEKLITDGSDKDSPGKGVTSDGFGNIYHTGLTQSSLFDPLSGESDFYLVRMRLE